MLEPVGHQYKALACRNNTTELEQRKLWEDCKQGFARIYFKASAPKLSSDHVKVWIYAICIACMLYRGSVHRSDVPRCRHKGSESPGPLRIAVRQAGEFTLCPIPPIAHVMMIWTVFPAWTFFVLQNTESQKTNCWMMRKNTRCDWWPVPTIYGDTNGQGEPT